MTVHDSHPAGSGRAIDQREARGSLAISFLSFICINRHAGAWLCFRAGVSVSLDFPKAMRQDIPFFTL